MLARVFALFIALTSLTHASPRASRRSVVETLLAARRECAKPGPRLTALVERVFDPQAFGSRMIARWTERSEAERAAFVALADRVAGGEERAEAIRAVCVPKARVTRAWEQGEGLWFVKLYRPDIEDCTDLMFRDDGQRWSYDGVWFCGKSLWAENWKRRLGGERDINGGVDYDTAMAHLRAMAEPPE